MFNLTVDVGIKIKSLSGPGVFSQKTNQSNNKTDKDLSQGPMKGRDEDERGNIVRLTQLPATLATNQLVKNCNQAFRKSCSTIPISRTLYYH